MRAEKKKSRIFGVVVLCSDSQGDATLSGENASEFKWVDRYVLCPIIMRNLCMYYSTYTYIPTMAVLE